LISRGVPARFAFPHLDPPPPKEGEEIHTIVSSPSPTYVGEGEEKGGGWNRNKREPPPP